MYNNEEHTLKRSTRLSKKQLESQRTKFLVARTEKQKEYIRLIKTKTIVFALGEAGTGKTRCACSIALEELYAGRIQKIILTRPVLEAGESLGFLPGDLSEKINPYMLPIYNEFQESIDEKEMKALIENKKIEIVPIAFMRGHTFKDCIVIADELQNASFKQIKTLLTRLGESGRLIINGDLNQSDLPSNMQGGLKDVVNKLADMEEVGLVVFDRDDIVRSPLIGKILDRLDRRTPDVTEPPIRDSWREYYDEDDVDD